MDHYLGIDVGTGSARACIIDGKGDIVGLASENIGLWQPEQGYYVIPLPCPTNVQFSDFPRRSNPRPIYGDVFAIRCSVS